MHGVVTFDLKAGVENPLDSIYDQLPQVKGIDDMEYENKTPTLSSEQPDLRYLLYWYLIFLTKPYEEVEFDFYGSGVMGEYEVYFK